MNYKFKFDKCDKKYINIRFYIYDITKIYLDAKNLYKVCNILKKIYTQKENDIFIIQQIVADVFILGGK